MPQTVVGVRSSASGRQAREILTADVTTLLGVTQAAATALKTIGIDTVFDLGASGVFAQARTIALAAEAGTPPSRFGVIPGDWVRNEGVQIEALPQQDITQLRAITPEQAAAFKSALDVTTIGDLAAWPPYVAAYAMVSTDAGTTMTAEELQAEELRPRFGEFPTERVYYSSLVMLHMNRDEQLTEITAPIAITGALRGAVAANKPAVGAIVTMQQSWYAQGVTLGQMLHSLALAPGEATRIAMIDWSRVTSARTSETIGESEGLSNQQNHSRAISEVQSAVARESQRGGSKSSTSSSTYSVGASGGIAGVGDAIAGALGISGGGGWASSEAESTSWSRGAKSVTSKMAQNVADSTSQHSTLVRNRRATAVREVSQSEHEQVSTRIVANYNHMHALTVQYYEVVQIYRVETGIHKVDRVLLIPIQPIDFTNNEIVESLRGSLIPYALTRRARELLTEPTGVVMLTPGVKFQPSLASTLVGPMVSDPSLRVIASAASAAAAGSPPPPPPPPGAPPPPAAMAIDANAVRFEYQTALMWERDAALANAASIFGGGVTRLGSSAYYFPAEVEIASVKLDGLTVNAAQLTLSGSRGTVKLALQPGQNFADLDSPRRLTDFSDIQVQKGDNNAQAGVVRLVLSYRGRRFDSPPFRLTFPQGRQNQWYTVLDIKGDAASRLEELKQHLMANQGHYTAAAFRSLDSVAIAGLISAYSWNGRPLIDQIEPRILQIAGNYIVFNAPVDDDENAGFPGASGGPQKWSDALAALDLTPQNNKKTDHRLIPIPTAGVFAEAVLGRSNSAEKIDLTRFWNWQESPPPFAPPEISPVATGSRRDVENLMPSQLGAANLGIQAPTALPDPAGLGPLLTALAAGNTFRDMSGLSGTQVLAKAGLDASGAAMKTAIENSAKAMEVAADLYKAGKPDEAKAVLDNQNKQVKDAKDAHAQQAQNAQAAGVGDGSSSGTSGFIDTVKSMAGGVGNAIASGASSLADVIGDRKAAGIPVPSEPPPSDTLRGGLMNRTDEKKASEIIAAKSSRDGGLVPEKAIRVSLGLGVLPVTGGGDWSLSITDKGFPGGDPLHNVATFRSGARVAGGAAIKIAPEREYRGPISVFMEGKFLVDAEAVDDLRGEIRNAYLGPFTDGGERVLKLMGDGPQKPKVLSNIYTWNQDVDVDDFLHAIMVDFRLTSAQKETISGTVEFPGALESRDVGMVQLERILSPPDGLEPFHHIVTAGASYHEWPIVADSGSPRGFGPIMAGVHRIEIERYRIASPQAVAKSIRLHLSWDSV